MVDAPDAVLDQREEPSMVLVWTFPSVDALFVVDRVVGGVDSAQVIP